MQMARYILCRVKLVDMVLAEAGLAENDYFGKDGRAFEGNIFGLVTAVAAQMLLERGVQYVEVCGCLGRNDRTVRPQVNRYKDTIEARRLRNRVLAKIPAHWVFQEPKRRHVAYQEDGYASYSDESSNGGSEPTRRGLDGAAYGDGESLRGGQVRRPRRSRRADDVAA